jgi:flagella synthesis protein FlgN
MTDLLRTLTAEADAVLRFVELLKQEQQSLAAGDVDALTPLVSQKNILATDLAILAKQRNVLLAVENFAPDRAGIDAWCEHHPAKNKVRAAWSGILSLASEACELNRVNGELIQIRMQHNTQALAALQGASRPLNLYGADGQTVGQSSRRINDAA